MSQSISTSLQIGAVFEILLLSFFGIALPFLIIYYRNNSKTDEQNQSKSQSLIYDEMDSMGGSTFHIMKAVSVGVMLGLAMVRVV